jgi:hypothetical protein
LLQFFTDYDKLPVRLTHNAYIPKIKTTEVKAHDMYLLKVKYSKTPEPRTVSYFCEEKKDNCSPFPLLQPQLHWSAEFIYSYFKSELVLILFAL